MLAGMQTPDAGDPKGRYFEIDAVAVGWSGEDGRGVSMERVLTAKA
jgi:hypothetical protein